jgi:hypothetical protein
MPASCERPNRGGMNINLKTFIRVLAELSRIDEYEALFSTPSGAQFRSLSRQQQDRALDRGYGPP